MFYLNTFFIFLRSAKTKILFFYFCSILVLGHFYYLRPALQSWQAKAEDDELSYFSVLVTDKEIAQKLSRKVYDLPGVKKIKIFEEISQNYSAPTREDSPVNNSEEVANYQGMAIYIAPGLKESSIELIRNFILQSFGEENVVLGKVFHPGVKILSIKNRMAEIHNQWENSLLALGLILWMISAVLLYRPLKAFQYLQWKYQDRPLAIVANYFILIIPLVLLTVISLHLYIQKFSTQLSGRIDQNYFFHLFNAEWSLLIPLMILFLSSIGLFFKEKQWRDL